MLHNYHPELSSRMLLYYPINSITCLNISNSKSDIHYYAISMDSTQDKCTDLLQELILQQLNTES